MKIARLSLIAVVLMLATGGAVSAAEPQGWRFEVAPYAWLIGIDGTLTVNGTEYDYDRDFEDLIDSVDFAFGLLGVARMDRWVALGQVDYSSLDSDNEKSSAPARLEIDQTFAVGAVGYEFPLHDRLNLDVLGGVRYGELDNTLTGKPTDRKVYTDFNATDVVLLLRPRILLSEKLFLNLLASVGGGDSELVYELQPELLYVVNETVDLRAGYRYLHYEFDKDGDELDMNFSGLLFGMGFRF